MKQLNFRRTAWHAAVVLAAAFVAVACGGGADDSLAEVEPISTILDGDILIDDITDTSAVVRVTTGVAVVCSVVYGENDSYGAQSTDLDMGGAAHQDHHAPMRGLKPDTVYHYRLQGTASDGTLFVSEDRTFKTLAESATADPAKTNLATLDAGATIIEASSAFGDSPNWAPENAIDGDPLTEWSSQGDGNDAFITVKLAGPTHLDEIGVWTRTMGASAQIETIQVVLDDGTVLGPFELPDAEGMVIFSVDVTTQSLRFEVVSSSGGNTGLVDVAAFGSSVDE